MVCPPLDRCKLTSTGNTVQKFDTEGTRLFSVGLPKTDFQYPYGIDVDDSGNFIVADTGVPPLALSANDPRS